MRLVSIRPQTLWLPVKFFLFFRHKSFGSYNFDNIFGNNSLVFCHQRNKLEVCKVPVLCLMHLGHWRSFLNGSRVSLVHFDWVSPCKEILDRVQIHHVKLRAFFGYIAGQFWGLVTILMGDLVRRVKFVRGCWASCMWYFVALEHFLPTIFICSEVFYWDVNNCGSINRVVWALLLHNIVAFIVNLALFMLGYLNFTADEVLWLSQSELWAFSCFLWDCFII